MQVLALDTATPFPSVTLIAQGEIREEALPDDRRASEELLPAIARCLEAAGAGLSQCDRIAVCSGPGSFTGLRIGLATAWALGRAAAVPIETVPTLEALAETGRGMSWGQALRACTHGSSSGQAPGACTHSGSSSTIVAVLDAGRGEVVLEVFSLDRPRAHSIEPQRRMPLAEARARAADLPVVSLPHDLLGPGGMRAEVSPSRALALAVSRAPGQETLGRLQGIYSRPSAAEEKRGAP